MTQQDARPLHDDIISLFGEHDIDQDIESDDIDQDNVRHHASPSVISHPDQAHADVMSTEDDFLDSVDTTTSVSIPKSPPISDHLSKILNSRFQNDLDSAQRKQIQAKHLLPENCTKFYAPCVNPPIWSPLKAYVKLADRSLVVLQEMLITSSSAIATTLEDILKFRNNKIKFAYTSIVSRLIDALSLMGAVAKDLSYRRKEALKPFISQEYRAACNRTVKPAKLIFGDDLSKTMQDVKATNRIVQTATASSRRATGSRPFNRRGAGSYSQRSFLSQRGRGSSHPPRSNQYQQGRQKSSRGWSQI